MLVLNLEVLERKLLLGIRNEIMAVVSYSFSMNRSGCWTYYYRICYVKIKLRLAATAV